MKKIRKIITSFLTMTIALAMLVPAFSGITVSAAEIKGEYYFDVITEVLDYGQAVTAVIIDAGRDVVGSSISAETFKVNYQTYNPDGETWTVLTPATISKAYVSAANETGTPADQGEFIVLELNSNNSPSTHDGNTTLTLQYFIEQNETFTFTGRYGDVSTVDSTYCQQAVRNLIVDDFKYGDTYTSDDGATIVSSRYYDPSDKYEAPEEGFPLVLFLHGGGESGTGNNLQLIANKGAVVWAEQADENPAYVLAPQTNAGWSTQTVAALVMEMLQDFTAEHNVDTNRIYIQGMSMGSMGTWEMLLRYPDYFAAAIPICGGTSDAWLQNAEAWAALKNVPIWAACAQDDFTYAGVEATIAALRAGGTNCLKYYQYNPGSIPVFAHLSWVLVYNDYEIYTWLFQQSKARTQNGTIDPKTLFKHVKFNDEITVIYDYDVDPMYLIEKGDKAMLIDTGMSSGSLYQYIVNEVLVNKDIPIEIYIPHRHYDHIAGLSSFVGADQLKAVYVHEKDSDPVKNILGADSGKVVYVNDGDTIPLGGDAIEIITVFGHSAGHTAGLYKDYLFTSDCIGSGYVWMSGNYIDAYVDQLQHLNEAVAGKSLTLLPGHAQYKGFLNGAMTDQYVRDILECAKGIVDGSIVGRLYERSTPGSRIGTYGTASIVYHPDYIHTPGVNYFDLVTEVYEYGQDVTTVIIDAGKEVDGSTISADTFSVNTVNTNPINNAQTYSGGREITNAYVNDVKEADGIGKESGRYIILELKHGFTVAGATALVYTGGANYKLNLGYKVTQNAEYTYSNGEIAKINAVTYEKQDVIDLVVDDFEMITYNDQFIRVYAPESDEALPLVLWNHGAGETYRTSGSINNEGIQIMANMGGVAWVQDDYPCYVVAPQRGTGTGYTQANTIAYIDELIAAGKVDPKRIYVAGCSAGGGETLSYLRNYPSYFTAALPICPAGSLTDEQAELVKDIPMWFFHSADDPTIAVSRTRATVAQLNALHPKEIKYTELENIPYSEHGISGTYNGHWSWIPLLNNYYSEDYGTNVFDWLFSKTKPDLDYRLLDYTIQYAEEIAGEGALDGVIPSVVEAFENALANAKTVRENATRQEQIDNATDRLIEAIHYLEFKQADKSELIALIEFAEKYEAEKDSYIPSTYAPFEAAMAAARAVAADGEVMDAAEVEKAWTDLANAILGLRLQPDKSRLSSLLNDASTIEMPLYTPETVALLINAMDLGITVMENKDAVEEEVKEAEKAIEESLGGLQLLSAASGNSNTKNTDSAANVVKSSGTSNPKTGDTAPIGFIVLAALCGLAIPMLKNKKK